MKKQREEEKKEQPNGTGKLMSREQNLREGTQRCEPNSAVTFSFRPFSDPLPMTRN